MLTGPDLRHHYRKCKADVFKSDLDVLRWERVGKQQVRIPALRDLSNK